MLVIPAIDLYKGKVVRLTRGDPSLSKVYGDNPVEIAKQWVSQGAKLLHIVDLCAALGEGDNISIIKDIVKEVKTKIEVGGGIRSLKKAKELISLGVERIVIGTKILDEDFLNKLIKLLGADKISVGVDVINSCIAIEGWKTKTDFDALDFIAYLQLKGIKWLIYTDILRDGTLEGVDYKVISKLAVYKDMNIIFAGGISSLEDIKRIKQEFPFVLGVITGKALYEGRIQLSEVIGI